VSPLYVYAIADRGADPGADVGIAGEPLAIVEGRAVAALVGAMDAPPAVGAGALRAHDRVVRRLAERAEAVLPARFGSVAADARTLRAALDDAGEAHAAALDRVRGREQMTLRVLDPGTAAASPGDDHAEAGAGDAGPGARYLAERARESGASGIPGLRPLLDRLAAHVHAESIERHRVPPLRASVFHLIDRGTSARYLDALRAASADFPEVRVVPSGPWPPYAFTSATP
jgi:hypothetical protein